MPQSLWVLRWPVAESWWVTPSLWQAPRGQRYWWSRRNRRTRTTPGSGTKLQSASRAECVTGVGAAPSDGSRRAPGGGVFAVLVVPCGYKGQMGLEEEASPDKWGRLHSGHSEAGLEAFGAPNRSYSGSTALRGWALSIGGTVRTSRPRRGASRPRCPVGDSRRLPLLRCWR